MTGPFSLVSDIAMEYRRRGLSPIPLRAREKEPFHATWPSMPEIDNWTPYNECNVGIRLGKPSNGVIDADLDWPEARALAPFVLPPTQSIFGRATSRGAHRLYRCSDPPERASQQWLTPVKREGEKGCILEIRSTGGQTMAPPSVHPCGETLEWESDGPPSEVEIEELRRAASVCVAAALLMRHWPDEGSRFFAYGAAIGAFLRWGVPADIVQEIIRIIAEKFTPAHDRTKRVRAVTKMAANLAAGTGRVPGYRRLKQVFGEQIARTVRSCLVSLGDGSVYRVIGGALCYMKADRNDLVIPVKLANFSARIVEDQILDDGAVEERRYRIAGALADGFALPTITVPVDKFAGTGWVERGWGASAIVAAGAGTSMITTAIKTVSVARERRIYAHLGWLQLYDEWVYLHAGGAIGANGPVAGIDVEIGGELAHMELLAPRNEQEAVRAALEMLRMGDIGCVVACAAWRAPTAAFLQVTVSPFLVGPTGVFKSAVLGLGQAMWGPRWDGTRFPANWSGTVNANEKMAYAAKDAFLIIDDFNPHGTRTEIAAKHADADRLLRAQGNLGGRARMRPDTSLRPEYVPRGMIGSSGEDLPWGASLRARLYPVRVKQGDIDKGQLTAMQAAAADGLLAEAMAGYVRYLAPCCDVLPEKLRKRRSEIRAELVVGHARTPDNVASLIIGLELFLGYACNIGAISREEVLPFRSGGIEVLKRRAAAQANEQHEADPVIQFMDSTQAMLASGGAHLRSPDGERPINPEQCGWRKTGETDSMTGEPRDAWVPTGKAHRVV